MTFFGKKSKSTHCWMWILDNTTTPINCTSSTISIPNICSHKKFNLLSLTQSHKSIRHNHNTYATNKERQSSILQAPQTQSKERNKTTLIREQILSHTCRKIVKWSFPSLASDLSKAWQAFSMSRKHVTGSLLIAKTMSPCSKRFSAFDPAKQPLTRKTWRLTGSFLTSAYNNCDQIKTMVTSKLVLSCFKKWKKVRESNK